MKIGALIISRVIETAENRIDALEKIGTISALQRVVLTFKRAGVENIYIVSNQEESTKRELSKLGVTFIPAESGVTEMFYYVKTGLTYLQEKEEYLFIMPSNVPLFTTDTIKKLSESRNRVTIPVYRGVSGHPVLINGDIIPCILNYQGPRGLSGAVKSLDCEITRMEVDDKGVAIYELDDEEFTAALDNHSLNEFYPEVRVRLGKEKPFLGPGTKQLLLLVEETGSLRLACDYMGISYSKGRGMVDIMEKQLGYNVLERRQGGEAGGSSSLTSKGAAILERYEEYEKKVREYAEKLFYDYF